MSKFTPRFMNVFNLKADGPSFKRFVLAREPDGKCTTVQEDYITKYFTGKTFKTCIWRNSKELKEKQYMTKNEMLGFLYNTLGIQIKTKESSFWLHFNEINLGLNSSLYVWRTIDSDGNVGKSQEFLK